MPVLFIVLIILLIIFGPFILICGLNFLLEAGHYPELPYTFGTWFGSLLIGMVLSGSHSKTN